MKINEKDTPVSLAHFFSSCAPGSARKIANAVVVAMEIYGKNRESKIIKAYLNVTSIRLECEHPECGGVQNYDVASDSNPRRTHTESLIEIDDNHGNIFVKFTCRNCRTVEKDFALHVMDDEESSLQLEEEITRLNNDLLNDTNVKQARTKPLLAICMKYGELPPFGPSTPSKLISVLRPEQDLFVKGRRAEAQGLGIAAYAYYRRVVEVKWRALVGEMEKIAINSGSPQPIVEKFAQAKNEKRFSNAVDLLGDALPPSLLVNGHNPLTVLHRTLSDGIHNFSDEQCLELAGHVRVVLVALAERISQSLAEKKALDAAVTALLALPSK
jgi:hypothetical protein